VRVRRSTIIDAPVEEVWRFLRDFNAHESWHPAVAESRIEDARPVDAIGAVRRFRLHDGGQLREQLLTLSDRDRRLTYCILDAPLPLIDYVATFELKSVTDGARTFWDWRSEFRAPPGREQELTSLVGEQIYEAGFEAVKRHFGQASSPARYRAAAPSSATAMQAQAVFLARYGGPEELIWQSTIVPPPAPNEIRVRHAAVGVNFIDVYCRTGYFRMVEPPAPLGMEAAGVVLDVGADVVGFAPGDRVAYACPPVGAYADVRNLPADLVVPLPDFIDDETAAAVMLKGLTAAFLLHRVHDAKAGEVVLIHAAAGGVGHLLCQWARHLGCEVIGTVGTREKAQRALAAGCAHVILSGEDLAAGVDAITKGHGCDVIYDAIGGDSLVRSFPALAERGHIVSFGQAARPLDPLDVAGLAAKSATVSRPNYGHYAGTAKDVRAGSARLFAALERGILKPEIGLRLPLRDAAEAHRRLESRATVGATILIP
jgi:NADPH:quinone reductase-like Zn-dependent oxidoreductase